MCVWGIVCVCVRAHARMCVCVCKGEIKGFIPNGIMVREDSGGGTFILAVAVAVAVAKTVVMDMVLVAVTMVMTTIIHARLLTNTSALKYIMNIPRSRSQTCINHYES